MDGRTITRTLYPNKALFVPFLKTTKDSFYMVILLILIVQKNRKYVNR